MNRMGAPDGMAAREQDIWGLKSWSRSRTEVRDEAQNFITMIYA